MIALSYWLIELLSPFVPYYEWFYDYGTRAQFAILGFILISYLLKPTNRVRSGLLLISLHIIYTFLADIILGGVTQLYYVTETSAFAILAVWVAFRYERVTSTLNTDNVLLAFYRGNNGSFRMMVAGLLGEPVKSVCVLASGKVLRIKNGTFVFTNGAQAIINSKDYLVIDTNATWTREFLNDMQTYDKVPAKSGFFRCDCIETIEPLLGKLGDRFIPPGLFGKLPGVDLGGVQ